MRWLTIDVFMAIFDDICFYADSGRRTDEYLKRNKMIVSRCQHVCFAGIQCRISSDSWQNKSHQSDIFCKRLVADFLRATFPEAKVNCCKPLSPELIINGRFCGLGKQYIRKLQKKTLKKRMKLSASRIKLEEEEHN